MKILDILNANVYLTNIISIPIIILIYLIVQDIKQWKTKDADSETDTKLHLFPCSKTTNIYTFETFK